MQLAKRDSTPHMCGRFDGSVNQILFLVVLACLVLPVDIRLSLAQSTTSKDAVWDFVVPESDRPGCDLEARKLPDGDILLTYGARCSNHRPQEIKNVTFLGRKAFRSLEEAFGGKYVSAITARQFTTKKGTLVWTIGPRAHPTCYVALAGSLGVYEVGGPPRYARTPITQKRVLWLFETPKRYTAPFAAPCGVIVPFTAWAETIGDYVVPLDDGTFVLVDAESAVAIRLDEALQTRSKFINRRLFLIDVAEFDRAVRAGMEATSGQNYAEAHRVLLRLIQKLQGGDK